MSSTDVSKCSIIVPVYNEAGAISKCVDDLMELGRRVSHIEIEIVCVNDGSVDGTKEILDKKEGIIAYHHAFNRGYGAALQTGISISSGDWIAIVDADGSYPISQLETLFKECSDEVDMVVGARTGKGITVHPHRRLARWVLRQLVRGLTGVMVPDLNSGMRVFRRLLFDNFRHLLPFGFSFTSTLTVASLYSGFRVKYISVDYLIREGKSHIRPVHDFLAFVILIVRLASYFEPLRFFFPFSFLLFAVAVGRTFRDIVFTGRFGGVAILLFFFSLQVFFTGILADIIVRRSNAVNPVRPRILPRGKRT